MLGGLELVISTQLLWGEMSRTDSCHFKSTQCAPGKLVGLRILWSLEKDSKRMPFQFFYTPDVLAELVNSG